MDHLLTQVVLTLWLVPLALQPRLILIKSITQIDNDSKKLLDLKSLTAILGSIHSFDRVAFSVPGVRSSVQLFPTLLAFTVRVTETFLITT